MRNQGQIIIGMVLLLAGLAFLAGEVLDVDLWSLCWPAALIVLGVWLLLRPRLSPTGARVMLFGDVKEYGAWQVHPDEIWVFIGDVSLDMTRAEIPAGETTIRVFGFIGDIDLRLPAGVGVSVSSTALVTDAKIFGRKHESFLTPVQAASNNYAAAERKVRLETVFFIDDIDVEAPDTGGLATGA